MCFVQQKLPALMINDTEDKGRLLNPVIVFRGQRFAAWISPKLRKLCHLNLHLHEWEPRWTLEAFKGRAEAAP